MTCENARGRNPKARGCFGTVKTQWDVVDICCYLLSHVPSHYRGEAEGEIKVLCKCKASFVRGNWGGHLGGILFYAIAKVGSRTQKVHL